MTLESQQIISRWAGKVARIVAVPLFVLLPFCYLDLEKLDGHRFLPFSFISIGALICSLILGLCTLSWLQFYGHGWKRAALLVFSFIPFFILTAYMDPLGMSDVR